MHDQRALWLHTRTAFEANDGTTIRRATRSVTPGVSIDDLDGGRDPSLHVVRRIGAAYAIEDIAPCKAAWTIVQHRGLPRRSQFSQQVVHRSVSEREAFHVHD